MKRAPLRRGGGALARKERAALGGWTALRKRAKENGTECVASSATRLCLPSSGFGVKRE